MLQVIPHIFLPFYPVYRDMDSLVVKVSKFIHQILLSTFLQEFGLVFLQKTNDLRWTLGRAVLNSFNRFSHSVTFLWQNTRCKRGS